MPRSRRKARWRAGCFTARWDWAPKLPPARRRQARSEVDAERAQDRRPAGVLENPRATGRPLAHCRLRRRAARQGAGPILRRHRHAADRRLRTHRRRRAYAQSARSSEVRQHRRRAAGRRASSGRRWRAADKKRDAFLRILQGPGIHRGGAARRLALHRRHRRDSIPTATSTSPAARRN